MSPLKIHYRFRFKNGQIREVSIKLDEDSLALVSAPTAAPPEWARLTVQQCHNCPLDPTDHAHCPSAVQLAEVVERFQDCNSYEEVVVKAIVAERTYVKETALQQGLGNLVGLIMATAGCPVLEPLRPMVRFHLPFASMEETEFRMVAMYLVAQYLRQKNGQEPDWSLMGLSEIYERVKDVNNAFAERIRSVTSGDAGVNALVILDCFAKAVPFAVRTRMNEYEKYFASYWR